MCECVWGWGVRFAQPVWRVDCAGLFGQAGGATVVTTNFRARALLSRWQVASIALPFPDTEPSTLVANGPLAGVEAAVGYQDGSLSLHALGSAAPVSAVRLATQTHVMLGFLLQVVHHTSTNERVS